MPGVPLPRYTRHLHSDLRFYYDSNSRARAPEAAAGCLELVHAAEIMWDFGRTEWTSDDITTGQSYRSQNEHDISTPSVFTAK